MHYYKYKTWYTISTIRQYRIYYMMLIVGIFSIIVFVSYSASVLHRLYALRRGFTYIHLESADVGAIHVIPEPETPGLCRAREHSTQQHSFLVGLFRRRCLYVGVVASRSRRSVVGCRARFTGESASGSPNPVKLIGAGLGEAAVTSLKCTGR